MLGACVQPSSSLSYILHVATAMYAEASVSEIVDFNMKPIPILWGEKTITNVLCV